MPNSRLQREKQRKKTRYSTDSDSEREKSRKYREKSRSKAKDRRSRDRERSSSHRHKERRKRYSSSSSSSDSSRSSSSSSRNSRSSSSSSRGNASSKASKSTTKKNCKLCKIVRMIWSFFSDSLLVDHITKFEINDLYKEENKSKIIDGIEAESFKQENFQSQKKIVVDLKKDKMLVPEPLAADPEEESLIHPNFLGDEEAKVDKWVKKLHLYRNQWNPSEIKYQKIFQKYSKNQINFILQRFPLIQI